MAKTKSPKSQSAKPNAKIVKPKPKVAPVAVKPKFGKIKPKETPEVLKAKKEKFLERKKLISKAKSEKLKVARGQLSRVIRITNVPNGFVEEPAFNYFSQYGKVNKVAVMRNKRGAFSGVIYVGFKFPEVAAIVASTLDKSLMGSENLIHVRHLLKREVPQIVNAKGMFAKTKVMPKKQYIETLIDEAHAKKNEPEDHSALVALLNSRLEKAKSAGIDYDFDFSAKLAAVGGINTNFTPAKKGKKAV